MINLSGVLRVEDIETVGRLTKVRFVDPLQFKDAESVILHEQNMLDDDLILELCNSAYDMNLSTPQPSYITRDIVELFREYDVVPIDYNVRESTITLGIVPDYGNHYIIDCPYKVKYVNVPLFYYAENRTRLFTSPNFLVKVPAKDLFEMIVSEALKLEASEIIVSPKQVGAKIKYMVKKQPYKSKRYISKEDSQEILDYICLLAGRTLGNKLSVSPRYLSIDLAKGYTGRVGVNRNKYGYLCSIRIYDKETIDTTLEDLNIEEGTKRILRDNATLENYGLNLLIGGTYSGKNTTILSRLNEMIKEDRYNIVSIEQPIEMIVDGLEQLYADTDEEFHEVAASLNRINPDIVYITEINALTAKDTLEVANMGKCVFSSVHANGIEYVILRLADLTGYSYDRIIVLLNICIFQSLNYNAEKDMLLPKTQYIVFTDELKSRLLGQPLSEIVKILKEEKRDGNT